MKSHREPRLLYIGFEVMFRFAMTGMLLMAALACLAQESFEVRGVVRPAGQASVTLHGSITPFSATVLSDGKGRFRFRNLLAGAYTVIVFLPGRGEYRQTIQVGPSTAGKDGAFEITVDTETLKTYDEDRGEGRHIVSLKKLKLPAKAESEFRKAQNCLSKRDIECANKHLERAVEIAPDYANAWNTLGTIAYQTRDYAAAEKYFRTSLEKEPGLYPPLVNLGGTLLSLKRPEEALPYNLHSMLARPNDALANSQLGMNYYMIGNLDLGVKYLNIAKDLDPAHFSGSQLYLAEIYVRKNDLTAAAAELESFLTHHPDWKDAKQMKQAIKTWRGEP